MASPIEATSVVTGEDAQELKASMAKVASPEAIELRKQAARQFYNTVSKLMPATGGADDRGHS